MKELIMSGSVGFIQVCNISYRIPSYWTLWLVIGESIQNTFYDVQI